MAMDEVVAEHGGDARRAANKTLLVANAFLGRGAGPWIWYLPVTCGKNSMCGKN